MISPYWHFMLSYSIFLKWEISSDSWSDLNWSGLKKSEKARPHWPKSDYPTVWCPGAFHGKVSKGPHSLLALDECLLMCSMQNDIELVLKEEVPKRTMFGKCRQDPGKCFFWAELVLGWETSDLGISFGDFVNCLLQILQIISKIISNTV